MTSFEEISARLGNLSKLSESGGRKVTLREDLESFSKTWFWIKDIRWLADLYMNGKETTGWDATTERQDPNEDRFK